MHSTRTCLQVRLSEVASLWVSTKLKAAESTLRALRDHEIAREFDQNHEITKYRESVRFDRERPKKDEKKEKKNHGKFFGQKKGQN